MRIRLAARLARLPRRTGRPGTGIGMSGRSAALDTSVAHPARRYDYWLGGKDNFAADRQSGDQIAAAFPDIVTAVDLPGHAKRCEIFMTRKALARKRILRSGAHQAPTQQTFGAIGQRVGCRTRLPTKHVGRLHG